MTCLQSLITTKANIQISCYMFVPHPQFSAVCSGTSQTKINSILADLKVERGYLTYTLTTTQRMGKAEDDKSCRQGGMGLQRRVNASAGRSDEAIMKLLSEPGSKENG